MKVKCEYCGKSFEDSLEKCPYCDAPNTNVRKVPPKLPKGGNGPSTIEEMKDWYRTNGFPPQRDIKFFIGKNKVSPYSQGIYQDEETKEFIVYKILSNGTRNVRYKGMDEQKAVQEAIQVLEKDVLGNQKVDLGRVHATMVPCVHCGEMIDSSLMTCPYCGGPNDMSERSAQEEPQTIEELKKWYKDRHLPPEDITRFFIGKDIKEAKAFGIYKDNNSGDFVVYKNKADGSRAVRYKGKDEAYAVNELYQRLTSEIVSQKNRNRANTSNRVPTGHHSSSLSIVDWIGTAILAAIIIGIVWFAIWIWNTVPDKGYYNYDGYTYYYQNNNWYKYDDELEDWVKDYDAKDYLDENWKDYYTQKDYDSSFDSSDFMDSDYYTPPSSSSSSSSSNDDDDDDWGSSWDNDYSWDSSDSWDSGSSDWDSDW